jgi:hypothetical protein
MLKIGTSGRPPLALPKPVPASQYIAARSGRTCISDLYYVWRAGDVAPRYDRNFADQPIIIGGKTYPRGLGFNGRSSAMFKLDGVARRFRAVVGVDPASQRDASCRFKIRNLDPLGPYSLLYDSGAMTVDSAPKTIDLNVVGVDCLILECDTKKAFANWGDVQLTAD